MVWSGTGDRGPYEFRVLLRKINICKLTEQTARCTFEIQDSAKHKHRMTCFVVVALVGDAIHVNETNEPLLMSVPCFTNENERNKKKIIMKQNDERKEEELRRIQCCEP